MSKLINTLKGIRITGVNVFGFQINLEDILSTKDIDERIKRLSDVKKDLEAAVLAVGELQSEALTSKTELDKLQAAVNQAAQDKETAEKMLSLPQESLSRIIAGATTKGRIRGIIEGLIIGLLTGAASSYLVWYLTKPNSVPIVPGTG